MALIAFCAIAPLENVTNAQPVGNKGQEQERQKQQDKRFGRLLNQHSLREPPQDDTTVLSST